ncbi:PaaI family thioesterase [Variovorax sp. J22R133]|uniref:PaaI family thioesterase n=1 Tax=Variovorax brevis TaxID=3053503 RepID=UPI0025776AAE|nr:PaaI family thioesterase [Variovorax sp. J22R133]MDM0110947.1 PaaI family thioesterase [Variovorax sp. J22R133]
MINTKTSSTSIEALARGFSSRIPHSLDIGMVFEDASPDGKTRMRLPPQPHLSGDRGGAFFFNGVLFSLADSACGLAVLRSLGQFVPIATLDMRIDHFSPATMDADLVAVAEVYRMTQSIAFARCELLCGPQSKLAANVVATFMLSSSSTPHPSALTGNVP